MSEAVSNELQTKKTQETTSYIDIKSASLRDILREICKDIRGVSLADITPSVRATGHLCFRR
jgi:hypothetical protein